MLLQIPTQAIEKGAATLVDKGLLGLFTLILIGVVYYMEKQRRSGVSDMKATIARLEVKVDAQQAEQEKQQQSHVEFIKSEYRVGMDLNKQCLEVLGEVKELLRLERRNH
jgi:uncharacterized membrane protein